MVFIEWIVFGKAFSPIEVTVYPEGCQKVANKFSDIAQQ